MCTDVEWDEVGIRNFRTETCGPGTSKEFLWFDMISYGLVQLHYIHTTRLLSILRVFRPKSSISSTTGCILGADRRELLHWHSARHGKRCLDSFSGCCLVVWFRSCKGFETVLTGWMTRTNQWSVTRTNREVLASWTCEHWWNHHCIQAHK